MSQNARHRCKDETPSSPIQVVCIRFVSESGLRYPLGTLLDWCSLRVSSDARRHYSSMKWVHSVLPLMGPRFFHRVTQDRHIFIHTRGIPVNVVSWHKLTTALNQRFSLCLAHCICALRIHWAVYTPTLPRAHTPTQALKHSHRHHYSGRTFARPCTHHIYRNTDINAHSGSLSHMDTHTHIQARSLGEAHTHTHICVYINTTT